MCKLGKSREINHHRANVCQVSDDIPFWGVCKNLLGICDMSAEVSMILNGVKCRWIELGKGRMSILAM